MFKTMLLSALIVGTTLSSAQAGSLRLKRVNVGGSSAHVVPLPPRRGQSGSVYAIVSQAAARHGVPERLAHAVIHVESKHNCQARNPNSSASGLGQLISSTARAMGVSNTMSCEQNANGAMRYLAGFYRQSGGNWCAAATAYNRGSLGGCSSYGQKVMRIASR